MIDIGKVNTLKIVKEVDFGLYLDGGTHGEILLPTRYVPKDVKVDEYIDVFIYSDSEDRLIATTETPLAEVNQFAYLKVKDVNKVGAFLNWGLMKDLMVPYAEQRNEMHPGIAYLVYVYLDKESERIVASSKLERYLDNVPTEYEEGQEVDLIIWDKTDLGVKVIINESHIGLLYANEIFQPLQPGQRIKGFIKKLREDEKLDVALQKQGYEQVEGISGMILEKLQTRGGFIEATDKTSPESIKHMFGISKKVFKKAIGALYKDRLIDIEKDGIRLIKK